MFIAPAIYADYVLPYPSYMPGNKLYRVTRVFDRAKKYWYWGNITRVKYHLGLSDKYLVEAKTLFEYKQYLLAADALARSDHEFGQLPAYLSGAKEKGVDISALKKTISDAAGKHREVLSVSLANVPSEFTWTPEKARPTELNLADMIRSSAEFRKTIASAAASL